MDGKGGVNCARLARRKRIRNIDACKYRRSVMSGGSYFSGLLLVEDFTGPTGIVAAESVNRPLESL